MCRSVLLLAIGCGRGSESAKESPSLPSPPSETGELPDPTTTLPTDAPMTCQPPPNLPEAGCCGEDVCGCALSSLVGALPSPEMATLAGFLAAHPTSGQSCLQTGLTPAYEATEGGDPSYHLRCEHPEIGAVDVIERWHPSMQAEFWVFGAGGALHSVLFSAEPGYYCEGTSIELFFGPYRSYSGCCEVRPEGAAGDCRYEACP